MLLLVVSLAVLGVIVYVVLARVLAWAREGREGRREFAERFGLEYQRYDRNLAQRFGSTLNSYAEPNFLEMRHVLAGTTDGTRFYVANVEQTRGGFPWGLPILWRIEGLRSIAPVTTIGFEFSQLSLPPLLIRPRRWSEPNAGIRLDSNSEVSRRYVITSRGSNEESLAELLKGPLPNAVGRLSPAVWHIEGGGEWLVMHWDRLLPAAELQEFLDAANEIYHAVVNGNKRT